MATIAAKAERRARVNQELADLSDRLATEFGIEIPTVSGTTRDQELDQIIELERVATIFRLVLDGPPRETESDSSGSDAAEGNGDEVSGDPDGEDVPVVDLTKLKLDELKAMAIEAGADADVVAALRTKAEVIALISPVDGPPEKTE